MWPGRLSGAAARSSWRKRKPPGTGPATIDPVDVVLAVSALNQQDLCPLGEELIATLIASTHGRPAWAVRLFLMQAKTTATILTQAGQGQANIASVLAPRLKYWVPAVSDLPESSSRGVKDGACLVHEDQILHLSGSPGDTLFFRYPLTGDFQFQCETQHGGQFEIDGSLRIWRPSPPGRWKQ